MRYTTNILNLRGTLKFWETFSGVRKFSHPFENNVTAQAFTYSSWLIQTQHMLIICHGMNA